MLTRFARPDRHQTAVFRRWSQIKYGENGDKKRTSERIFEIIFWCYPPLKSFVKVLKRQKFALIEEMVLSERSEFSISSIVFSKAPVSFRTLETIHREYIQKINLQKSPTKVLSLIPSFTGNPLLYLYHPKIISAHNFPVSLKPEPFIMNL